MKIVELKCHSGNIVGYHNRTLTGTDTKLNSHFFLILPVQRNGWHPESLTERYEDNQISKEGPSSWILEMPASKVEEGLKELT